MTAILKYDEACRAVSAARTFDEVREWEDKAAAVREYGRRIRNRSLEIDALEIRERSRRRRGELLAELKRDGRLVKGNDKVTEQVSNRLTLEDLDVSNNESSRDQKIAGIEGNSFERLIARCRAYMEENPDKHSVDVLRVKDGPVNGARSVMGSREEPDDSLDFFPTPPYATRALIQRVLPQLGVADIKSVWEPACGQGHIVGVLQEFGVHVYGTDIADYNTKYQDRLCNFLDPADRAPSVKPGRHDWVITNPPFGDKAIAFVLRALEEARVGVAMFFRSQWAVEGIERYQKLFRDRPPTLCAFFVERVNLRRGHYDHKGSTATAYCWLVWLQGAENPRAPFWIPPGCRKDLTRDDDHERFAVWAPEEPAHDPITGEISQSDSNDPDIPTAIECARAVAMRRDLYSQAVIAETLGRHESTIARHLRAAIGQEERSTLNRAKRQTAKFTVVMEEPPPPSVLADRDHRASLSPRDHTAFLCGDPLPGWSALERRLPL